MMRWLEREGVELWLDDTGAGEPAFVFVHGFAADHTHFEPQVEYFGARHRVVSVDLRGHGRSAAPDQEYTMEGYADDVAFVCTSLGLRNPVLVGHSMGGVVVALTGQRHPGLAGGLCIIDSAIVPRAELVGALVGWADVMRGPNFRDALRGVSEPFFGELDDEDLKRRIQDGMAAPQHVLISSAEHLAGFVERSAAGGDAATVGAWMAPACFIAAQMQMNDIDRFQSLCPDLLMGQTVGSGHYVTLGVPDQVNAMLERFLRLVLRRAGGNTSA